MAIVWAVIRPCSRESSFFRHIDRDPNLLLGWRCYNLYHGYLTTKNQCPDMFVKRYYTDCKNKVLIDAQQASGFAKDIAGDFNPLHDPDAKRFCVPGDLLFALVLEKYGLSQNMCFSFSGMVGRGVYLNFPATDADEFEIGDDNGKTYLKVQRSGATVSDESIVEPFIRNYVAFSGPNFPHVLVPLMASHNVMINTERPLVIYEKMLFEFDHLHFACPQLQASETTLEANGKRGNALLHFTVNADNKTVGKGYKKLVISGMRDYDQDAIQQFTENYLARMASYKSNNHLHD